MPVRLIADIASYQDGLTPADVRRAGFDTVNVKISHGLGVTSVHPQVTTWIRNTAGLAVATFHYLTGSASGVAQARYAYNRMTALGVPPGAVHTVDCEADASWQVIVEYVTAMRQLLRRPVALYTGDWWWQAAGRGWSAPDLLPYVWAAPSQGYLTRYPGDADTRWVISYAGHTSLAVMQYAVAPVVRAGGGPVNVSMSAVRDAAVWADLSTPREDGVTVAPDSFKETRTYIIMQTDMDPLSVGIVGDDNHQQTGSSYHLGKSALRADSYSIVESSRDRNGLTEDAAALDIGKFAVKRGEKTHTLLTFNAWLIRQCEAGTADTADIREVIYSPDGKVVKRWDRLGKRTSGDDSHLIHTHISYFRDSTKRSKLPLFQRYFREIEGNDLVTTQDEFTTLYLNALKDADVAARHRALAVSYTGGGIPSGMNVLNVINALYYMTDAVLKNVTADDGDLAQVRAAIEAAQQETVQGVIAGLTDEGRSDAEVAQALLAVLGSRGPAVGELMSGARS